MTFSIYSFPENKLFIFLSNSIYCIQRRIILYILLLKAYFFIWISKYNLFKQANLFNEKWNYTFKRKNDISTSHSYKITFQYVYYVWKTYEDVFLLENKLISFYKSHCIIFKVFLVPKIYVTCFFIMYEQHFLFPLSIYKN